MKLNIDNDAVVKYSRDLHKLHRSGLPSAVRGALNKAAFDVKTKTMPTQASKQFVNRQPNFFKANSKFENATGFNVSTMKSKVGFVSTGLKGGNKANEAVKDLQQQENGGSIRKTFIAMKSARVSNNPNKVTRANARLEDIKDSIINAKNARGKNKKEKFIKSVIHAGVNGEVLSNFKSKKIVWRVLALNRASNTKWKIKLQPLYFVNKAKSINVKSTSFMETASLKTAEKMEHFYIQEAKRQIDKLMRK